MQPTRVLAKQPRSSVSWPLLYVLMLLLSAGLVVLGPASALAAPPMVQAPVVSAAPGPETEAPTEGAEIIDDLVHDEQLADTRVQRTLLLTLGGLSSIGGGLTAWRVTRRSKPKH